MGWPGWVGWVNSVRLRAAAPVAAVIGVSGFLFLVRPLGIANAVDNSVAGNLALSIPFLIAYALGYEAGLTIGFIGVALLVTALQVANGGAFSPIPEMLVLGPWIAGRIVGSRRRLADQLRARNDELLAQQEAYAAEAVRYERSRIAADLHDIVGHALSLMVVQASAGQRAAGAQQALEAVAEAAREAQAEVGLLAGLLAGEQAPPPGLGLIAELVRQVQGAGVEVTYRLMADDDAAVDPTTAEIASRVVTEALTNALKHAPGAPVTVDVRAAGGELTVTVENGAARHSPDDLARAGGGYGLTGMRDRVLARGGHFDAGPAAGGGWRVQAVLPAQ
jgi:signal transduction histidine kinase